MANTFLLAQGIEVGKSLCEKDLGETALEILEKAKAAKCTVLLPVDVVVAGEVQGQRRRTRSSTSRPAPTTR